MIHRQNLGGKQPEALEIYNNVDLRKCKLTKEQVKRIRENYIQNVHGKLKLAKEYGVSKSVIHRIIQGESWKISN